MAAPLYCTTSKAYTWVNAYLALLTNLIFVFNSVHHKFQPEIVIFILYAVFSTLCLDKIFGLFIKCAYRLIHSLMGEEGLNDFYPINAGGGAKFWV